MGPFRQSASAAVLACLLAATACGAGERGEERERPLADVVSVTVAAAGDAGAWVFEVGVESPDRGCGQYADWWEVVTEDGRLLHRRLLRHSHVDEQPFVRGGGPVVVAPDEVVWVRAHMHPGGYGGAALRGSPEAGFEPAEPPAGFAAELAEVPPRPPACAW